MDKFLLIVAGGSFVGFFEILAVLAISSGHTFQGILVGGLGLMFLSVILALLVDA